ncbi:preprotein translocase subunit SecG [Actimicrobium sp. CCI2.3]|uniref:preprotein translocase subunit SecG n=1 Tax=Actimicrobium sp. CCI2.3 TaxID=3048616 RepID=UPI002AB39723|nr:preprotein translocase subunit SecG [Actimicrobium sp. CCI2.3]MDY7574284.1 preprotein translocase subunit SecG [Actimicrobium sp. CCI2.3]MEB0022716.1 preprotein translocase subunit SecG [Actimicrobium sp. CCI2.3]
MNTSVLTIIVIIQVVTALTIIGLVLMQHGKGADMGAAFGSGASGSLFGATGSSNFLSKMTGVAAGVFFATTLALAYFGSTRTASTNSVTDTMTTAPAAAVPGASVPPTAPVPSAPAPAPATPAGQSGQIPK